MPAFNSFTVNDRAATPVAHTFAPRTKEPYATYVEAGPMPAGERRIGINPRKSGSKTRITANFAFPTVVTEVINGVSVPKVARSIYYKVEATIPDDATQQERKDAIGMVANSLAVGNTQFTPVFVDLEYVW